MAAKPLPVAICRHAGLIGPLDLPDRMALP